jgi:MoxR-like ATPase
MFLPIEERRPRPGSAQDAREGRRGLLPTSALVHSASLRSVFDSIDATVERLSGETYIADTGLATSLFLALRMERALFLEGEPGVGKTEVAKVLSRVFETPLIRLQCYEGLDLSQAVYEWNYPRQLLEIQVRRGGGQGGSGAEERDIFSEAFLLKRPLLQAIDQSHERAPVLLIDELDRADEEFESFLLELLSDFQVTIPEIGTLRAEHKPITVITSNRTREIHDALKRRCVYHWIDYPSFDKEVEIVRRKVPGLADQLAERVVDFVQRVRREEVYKPPGISETLDWAEALTHLEARGLVLETVQSTLGFLLKYEDDVERLRGRAEALLEEVRA